MVVVVEFNGGDRVIPHSLFDSRLKKDSLIEEKNRNYKYFTDCSKGSVTIVGVDTFGLYALNNMLLRHIVSDNIDSDDVEYLNSPSIDPKTVKIYELDENQNQVSIQKEDGLIGKNYFNQLVNCIMDDFYEGLNYYATE